MFQDPKYAIFAVNRATGRVVPPYMPMMLFIGQDALAAEHAVKPYAAKLAECGPAATHASACERYRAFVDFGNENPHLIKMPGQSPAAHVMPAQAPAFPVAVQRPYTYWLTGGNVVHFVGAKTADGADIPGTTTEEVLDMLIDRVRTQDAMQPDPANSEILLHLTQARSHQMDRMRRIEQARDMVKAAGDKPATVSGTVQFGINMIDCQSSNLEAHGYRQSDFTLALRFKGGKVYHYANVPRSVYEGLLAAESVGSYASREITGKFEGVRQEAPATA